MLFRDSRIGTTQLMVTIFCPRVKSVASANGNDWERLYRILGEVVQSFVCSVGLFNCKWMWFTSLQL